MTIKKLLAIAVTLSFGACAHAEETADWYPSTHGADDRLGAMNNLSEAKTLAATKLISLRQDLQPRHGHRPRHTGLWPSRI